MITCEEIYGLHTSKTPESAIHAAYRDIPLDSRNGMRKNATPLHMACTFADETETRRYVCWQNTIIAGKKRHLPRLPDYCFPKEQEYYVRGKTRPP